MIAVSRVKEQRCFNASGLLLLLFVVLAVVILFPFYCILLGSFKPGAELVAYGLNARIEPMKMSINNYAFLFTGQHRYFSWYLNSLTITLLQTGLTLVTSSFVGYGFAMYNFRFKNLFFALVLVTMMVPVEIILLPLYRLMTNIRLMDTYAGVFLPFIAGSLPIFFFRQYLSGIPRDFQDAARVDGCTEYGIWLRIMVPLMAPAYAAMGIFVGMSSWNNFLWPLIVIRSQDKITLPLGLVSLITPYGSNYDLLVAGAVFAIIPIFILFLCFQQYFISGMTAGGVKG